jgi:O-antigen/teichoic acid export membrane protein
VCFKAVGSWPISNNYLDLVRVKNKPLKLNAVMNTLKTVSGLLFSLITFPYLSRTLGPEGTGWVSFAGSFASYFILFAGIGIPFYGVREIAKVRDSATELSAKTLEILIIHAASSILALGIYAAVMLMRRDLQQQHILFVISSISIPCAALSMEWFFQGKEEYVYITARTLAFSMVSLIALFLFIHTPEHYVRYAMIIMFTTFGTSALNFWQARKVVFGNRSRSLVFLPHLKSMATSYLILLISSVYLNLDIVFLGFMAKPAEVGYYSAASRFLALIWSLISSFGAVLIPRLSYYSENGQQNEFQVTINKSIAVTVMLCLPAMFAITALSEDVIRIFAGSAFLPAVACLNITLPGLLFASLANIFAWQILFPKRQDTKVIVSLLLAACISLVSNLVLISHFTHVGAAISKLVAELVVCSALYYQARKCCRIEIFPWKSTRYYVLGTVLMLVAVFIVRALIPQPFVRLVVSVPLGVIIYFGVLHIGGVEIVATTLHAVQEKLGIRVAKESKP